MLTWSRQRRLDRYDATVLEVIGVLAAVVSTIIAVMTYVRDGRRSRYAGNDAPEPAEAAHRSASTRSPEAVERINGRRLRPVVAMAVGLTVLTVLMLFSGVGYAFVAVVGALAATQWALVTMRNVRRRP
jgi:hypothetical protein